MVREQSWLSWIQALAIPRTWLTKHWYRRSLSIFYINHERSLPTSLCQPSFYSLSLSRSIFPSETIYCVATNHMTAKPIPLSHYPYSTIPFLDQFCHTISPLSVNLTKYIQIHSFPRYIGIQGSFVLSPRLFSKPTDMISKIFKAVSHVVNKEILSLCL